ncbi:MAG: bifunctional 5,10-methylenetetrahydrofolate dehydrogenase/5,10-methenyltetrahydrofolate cyclohydrolase, partial [Bdellovibrionales bacterium]|nr:bifunctional 5,10-methylenetetrahydrofolate dehydrogenase/5,10-methenyltetrahydrofolate cyclohydrolase [Bdellovibrionales bacterium]
MNSRSNYSSQTKSQGFITLDGNFLSRLIESDLKLKVAEVSAKIGRKPGLGVVLVGDNPASKAYVARKSKVAKRCGLESFDHFLSAEASHQEVLAAIEDFNNRKEVDGILLQLPLPEGLDEKSLISAIDPLKDADGLHPSNQGRILAGLPGPRPCTPLGALKLIDVAMAGICLSEFDGFAADIPEADLSGKSAIVIGRSVLVGKPLGLMLLERNATVTYAHSRTKDLPGVCSGADIVVAAVGVPNLVKPNWIKQGAIVIDVGINRIG